MQAREKDGTPPAFLPFLFLREPNYVICVKASLLFSSHQPGHLSYLTVEQLGIGGQLILAGIWWWALKLPKLSWRSAVLGTYLFRDK